MLFRIETHQQRPLQRAMRQIKRPLCFFPGPISDGRFLRLRQPIAEINQIDWQ